MSPITLLIVGMVVVVGAILWLRLHAFLALVAGGLAVALLTPAALLQAHADRLVEAGRLSMAQAAALVASSAPERLTTEFGIACGKLGLVIAMAAVVGRCLVSSGAARVIVEGMMRFFGEKRTAPAFGVAGFVLSIPVFFDTVFLLLMPLGIALFRRTGKDYLLHTLAIVAGGTIAHSLVPPTPGPIFVALELGVNLGTMVVGGVIVGSICSTAGYLFAKWANSRHTLTPQETPLNIDAAKDASADDGLDARPAPPFLIAVTPIVLPVALVTLGATLVSGDAGAPAWSRGLSLLTEKNMALTIAALAALGILAWTRRGDLSSLRKETGAALSSGAVIILITAAGAAFGGVLRQTGIAETLQEMAPESAVAILPVVFLFTALVRTAQGSATVAMITAAPIAVAFLAGGGLPFHPVYLALVIGCGSKPIPWMNDSGFWVITRMAGIRETDTLRFVSPMLTLMGVVGLGVCMLGAWLVPMVE